MYCISCLQDYPREIGNCPTCDSELFAYAPEGPVQAEIEKRHFLIDALRASEQAGIIDASQREAIARPHQLQLLHYRNDIMDALGLFDDKDAPEKPQEATTAATTDAAEPSNDAAEAPAALPNTEAAPLSPPAEAAEAPGANAALEAAPLDTTESTSASEELQTLASTAPTDALEAQEAEGPDAAAPEDEAPGIVPIEPPGLRPAVAEVPSQDGATAHRYDKLKAAFGVPPSDAEAAPELRNLGEPSPPHQPEGEADLLELQAQLGTAIDGKDLGADADPMSMPDFEEAHRYNEMDQAVMEQSAWSKYFKPFLVQNWLYFLGTFLVLASGFYLLSLAWEGMGNILRQSVIWGGLGTTALAFSGGGAYLHRKLGVDQAGQIFWLVGAGLLGSSAIAAGQAAQHSTLIFLLLLIGTLAMGLWLIKLLRPFDQGISRKLTAITMSGQLLLIGLVPALKQNQHARFWIFSFFYIGAVLLWQNVRQLRATLITESGSALPLLWSLRAARERLSPEESRAPGRWDWIMFVVPVAYTFFLMLGWAGWELSTVLKKRMALAWYGPLLVLMGSALLEFVFSATPPTEDTKDNEGTEDSNDTQAPAKDTPVSSWIGGAIGLGVVGVFVGLPHPPAQLFSSLAMCVMCLYIGFKWSRQGVFFLTGLSGLSAYVGALRVFGIGEIWGPQTAAPLHGANGLIFLPFLGVLFGGILWLGKMQRREGVKALRGLFLLLSLALFGIMAYDVKDAPYALMWGAPIYALAYLAIGEFNDKKGLAYLGLLMAGFWFGYGPTQWAGGVASRYAVSMIAFGICCFVMARLFERARAEGVLRRVFDEGFYLALPAIVVFWLQDPLFQFFHLERALRGAGGGPWQPQGVWMYMYAGLVLYGLCMLHSTRNTANVVTAYLSFVIIATGAGLLGVATPRWLGRPLVPWRAPLLATLGAFALFELSRRLQGGVRHIDARLTLFGIKSHAASDELWTRPARQFSYILLFAALILVGMRDLTVTVQLLFVYGLAGFVLQAGVRQKQRRFGYLFCAFFWLLGFLQLSWVDEYTQLDQTLGYILFFGGGCLLLSGALRLTRRWTSPEGQNTRWTAIAGPIANMTPLFLVLATLWQLEQSWQWVKGAHPSPGYLFVGWLVLTLSYYTLASLLRQSRFVYAGAISFVGMGLLAAHRIWSPLELLCVSTGFFAFVYAFGILKVWERFEAPHRQSGLWWIWRHHYRISGYALWGRSHRSVALFFGFWLLPALFFTWMASLYLSTGSEIMHLSPVAPWVVFIAAMLAGFPHLWEGYIQRKPKPLQSYRHFAIALFAGGMGLSLGSADLMIALKLDPEAPSTWALMAGAAALFYQLLMWLCRFRMPGIWRIFEAPFGLLHSLALGHREGDAAVLKLWDIEKSSYPGVAPEDPRETVRLYELWGRLWKVAHGWYLLASLFAAALATIALLDAQGQEYTFLALLFVPLALEQLQRPSRSTLLVAVVLGSVFWSTDTLPMGLSTTGIVLLAGIFVWKSQRQWDNVPLRSLFWLSASMGAVGFGFCIAILELMPPWLSWPQSWAGWCIALSVVAMGFQGWMWLCRKLGGGFAISDHFTEDETTTTPLDETTVASSEALLAHIEGASADAGPDETTASSDEVDAALAVSLMTEEAPQEEKYPWRHLRDKGPWEGLWYASLTCFGLASLLSSIATFSAYPGSSLPDNGWMLCLLPFLAMMPWALDQLQRPIKGTAIPVMLLASYGVYLTSGLIWRGTPSQWMLPVFVIGMVWLLLEQLVLLTGGSQRHSPRRRYYRGLALALTGPVLVLGLLFWLQATYSMMSGSMRLADQPWLINTWAQIGVPGLMLWFFLRQRSESTMHLWLITWFAWPLSCMAWLFGDLKTVTPGLMWAGWTFGLGLLYVWGHRGHKDADAEDGTIETISDRSLRHCFATETKALSIWASLMGYAGFAGLLMSTSASTSQVGTIQWLATAALITGGWLVVAASKGDSSRWILQASLAAVWSVHGLLLLFLPAPRAAIGLRGPGLFALLTAISVVLANIAAQRLKQGGMAWLWQPLLDQHKPLDGDEEDDVSLRELLWGRMARAFHSAAVMQTVLSSLLVTFAWVLRGEISPSEGRWVTDMAIIGSLVLLAWNWVRLAIFSQKDLPAYIGVGCFFGIYGYVRGALGVGSTQLDTWLLMIIGFVSVGFRILWQRMGGELLQRVIFRSSFVLPLAVYIATLSSGAAIPQGFWMLAGLFYGVIAHQYDRKILYVPALILVNIEFFSLLANVIHADPFTNPQWYALPFGFTLFAFSAIYRGQLNHAGRNALRNIGALAIYGCSMYQVVALNSIMDIMILAVLAIAGVIAGIMMHVRSYLYLGAVFLVLNISINLFRIGINDRIIGMVFLFVTGLLVLASAVFFNLKRDELLAKYKEWRQEIAEWD